MNPIYLSYFLDSKTPAYGGKTNSVNIHLTKSILNGDTSNDQTIEFPGHIGTHIDFPFHFSSSGKKCEDYPASFWIFNKVGFLTCEIEKVKDNLANLPSDIEILLLKTGFGSNRSESLYWANQPIIPSYFAELFREKFPDLRVFGFDMISLTSKLDRVEGKSAHINFLIKNEILILEDMNLGELFIKPSKVLIAPLQMKEASGVPCNVIAY
jgi:arylformamidase